MDRRRVAGWVLFALLVGYAVSASAEPPRLITYQGILTDQAGDPLEGPLDLVFKIYPDSAGMNALWTEGHNDVPVSGGIFNVILGRNVPLPSWIAVGSELWLGVRVGTDEEMVPRMRFTSVPWALRAAVADSALSSPGGADADWIIQGSEMYSGVSGNVGIGTTTPLKKLHVGNNTIPNAEGMIRLASRSGTNGSNRIWDIGVPETDATSTGYGYSFVVDDTHLGTDPEFMVKFGSGRVGIGTPAPARKLHIDCANVEDGIRVAWGSDWPSSYGEIKHTLSGGLAINSAAGGGSWADIQLQTNGTTRAYLTHDGKLGIGTSNPTTLLDVAGTAKVQILQIAGADVAEKFPVRDRAEPGMVVAIDPEHPGELCVARREYDRRVAGVVSGAGELSAGAVLGNLPGHEDSLPVALTGRVWVWCDDSGGPIEPGDLLTSATRPGHAMRAADAQRALGATIGKAMTSLAEGRGLVLVLVSLQ